MADQRLVLGIGELLWDVLPEGPRLGGAPANFSVMSGRLGDHALLLSRVGQDALGREALRRLAELGVDGKHIQEDAEQETGRVTVAFEGGQPSYAIHRPAAWDFLEVTGDWLALAARADAVCFGSLAQRDAASRAAIQAVVAATGPRCARVFDVNLRAPFYTAHVLRESLALATVVKMNDAEVPEVLQLVGRVPGGVAAAGEDSLRAAAESLLLEFSGLKLVAITCGGAGSLLVTRGAWHRQPGIPVEVVDTIGSGDAFTAAMTHYLLRGAPLEVLNAAGNRWGGWIASQAGAMPPMDEALVARMRDWIER